MKKLYSIIDQLLRKPEGINLFLLNKFLRIGIPFNGPHNFKISKLSADEVIILLPSKRINHNHLGGVHACAMATVGEYCAGLALLKTFGISKYRLILAELNVQYLYQGRTDLVGICNPNQIHGEVVQKYLERDGQFYQHLETIIKNSEGKEVALIRTLWQLKSWEIVKTK
jgi:acyl-coenzyme A thioesterase PaaI-like protein